MNKGQLGPVEQPSEMEFNPDSGWLTTRIFHGAKEAIFALANQFANQGYRVSTRAIEGGLHEVRATISTLPHSAEIPVSTWELLGADQQTDIRLHQYFDEVASDASAMEVIDQKLDDPDSVDPASGLATELYEFLRRGQNVYQETAYVLRYTQTSSANLQASIAVSGVNQLWTLGQIQSAHGGMPANIAAAINQIPEPDGRTGHVYKWLKSSPQLVKAFGQKTVITIEWKLYLWPTSLYPNA